MQVCRCGSIKVENKDTGLCASCNKAERREATREESKAQSKGQALQRRTGIQAKAYSLKRTAINPISNKQRAALKEKTKAYSDVSLRTSDHCETCGRTGVPLSRSHTLSVGQFKEHESNPDNIVVECFGSSGSCHDMWEHNKQRFRFLYPEAFVRKMEFIRKTEPSYHSVLSSKLGV